MAWWWGVEGSTGGVGGTYRGALIPGPGRMAWRRSLARRGFGWGR